MAIECEHGRLARKCPTCEDASEIAELRAERDAALDRVDRSLALVTVLTAERDALRRALHNPGATHWESCHFAGPAHYGCLREQYTTLTHQLAATVEEHDALQRCLDSIAVQEPASVPAGEWTPERVAAFNATPAPNRCVACGREAGPPPAWHVCGPQRASEPALLPADTDVLSGAEEMLRRIAASSGLYLDATEAGAIVAELDRLRGAAKKTQPRDKDEEQS